MTENGGRKQDQNVPFLHEFLQFFFFEFTII